MVPQDSFFVQKVKVTAPTKQSTEVNVDFSGFVASGYKEDGVTPSGYSKTYFTIDGVESSKLGDVFISYPNMTGLENAGGLRCFPYNHSTANDLSKAWGYHPDYNRDFFLRVQPGTRFYLSFNDHIEYIKVAQALVENGSIEKMEDYGWEVYTAENIADFENGTATRHYYSPVTVAQNSSVANFKYNFIIPENHTYVRIINPISGGLDTIKKSDGSSAGIGVRGNDRMLLDHITYTPFTNTYGSNYTYTGGTAAGFNYQSNAANGVYKLQGLGDGSGQKIGFANNWTTSYMFNVANKAIKTDAQLPYLIYKVNSDSYFNVVLDIKWGENSIWYKKAYDANNTDLRDPNSETYGKEYEDFYFEILTSNDGVTWTTRATLGLDDDIYMKQAVSDSLLYNVGVYVPTGDVYVKVLSHFRAGYNSAKDSANVVYNNTFAIAGASFDAYATPAKQEGAVSYDYTSAATGGVKTPTQLVTGNLANYGVYSQWAHYAITAFENSQEGISYNIWGQCVQKKGTSYVLKDGGLWGKIGPAYLVYKVEPGTRFDTRVKFGGSKDGYNTNIAYMKANGLAAADTPDTFDFVISASTDGQNWINPITSAEIGKNTEGTIYYDVPEDCCYIKVLFPQRGGITNGTQTVVDGVGYYNGTCGNDQARLYGVSYVPYGYVAEDMNNYTAKDATEFSDTAKVPYEVYDYENVAGTANGVEATDAGYVTYKVSDAQDLIVKTTNDLKFAVSYDGENFVDAAVTKYNGEYAIYTVGDVQYVKVILEQGEAITAIKATTLKPTVTFVNYVGNKVCYDVENYGDLADDTKATNKNRPGYTFDKWDNPLDVVYLDTTYTAEYSKSEELSFNVSLAVDSEGEITYADGVDPTAVRFDDRVTFTAPHKISKTEYFVKWVDGNGKIISNSSTFSFLVTGDIELTAVYGKGKENVDPFIYTTSTPITTQNDNGTWNMSVIWRATMASDVTVVETGIVLGVTDDEANLKLMDEGTNTAVLAHSSAVSNKTLMFTVNNIKDGKTRYALPYAKLSNGQTIFGTVVGYVDAANQ